MRCFRLVDPRYSDLADIVRAQGATKSGGRWNPIGTRAIYLSTTEAATFAEKGFYSIIDRAHILQIKANSPKENRNLLIDAEFSLLDLKLEVEPSDILDFTDQMHFSNYLKKASLPVVPISDSRLSPYLALNGRWTQKLGYYCSVNQKIGFKVKSARSDEGDNVVIFPENIKPSQLKLTQTTSLKLSAIDGKTGKKFTAKSNVVSASQIFVESNVINKSVNVLNFPL